MSDDAILRQRRVALTQADIGLLLRRMMAEIPGLKVVDAASLVWPADEQHPHLLYWDGEGDPPDVDVMLWVEHKGWREEWRYREDGNQLRLSASPYLACAFEACRMDEEQAVSVDKIADYLNERGLMADAADPSEAVEAGFLDRILLSEGTFWAIQYEDDKTHKALLDKIFAMVEEECSDRLVWASNDGSPEAKVLKRFVWAGPDALRWAQESAKHCLAHSLRPLASLPPEAQAAVAESYGLHIVEPRKFHDFIELRVPASWPVFTRPDGRGIACDEDSDNGTLWVDFHVQRCGEHVVMQVTKAAADVAYELWSTDGEHRDVTRLETGSYLAVYGVSEPVEDGTPLQIFSWSVYAPIQHYHVNVVIHLVLTHDNLADPLCEGAVEVIKDSIANIRIDEEAFWERVLPRPLRQISSCPAGRAKAKWAPRCKDRAQTRDFHDPLGQHRDRKGDRDCGGRRSARAPRPHYFR